MSVCWLSCSFVSGSVYVYVCVCNFLDSSRLPVSGTQLTQPAAVMQCLYFLTALHDNTTLLVFQLYGLVVPQFAQYPGTGSCISYIYIYIYIDCPHRLWFIVYYLLLVGWLVGYRFLTTAVCQSLLPLLLTLCHFRIYHSGCINCFITNAWQ